MKTETETAEAKKPFNQVVNNVTTGETPAPPGAKDVRASQQQRPTELGPRMVAPGLITVRSNTRKIFDAAKQKELEASIAEQGIVQRLVVRRLQDGQAGAWCAGSGGCGRRER